jgi:hypothetical protein
MFFILIFLLFHSKTTTFLGIIIITLCYVNKFNSSMPNFGGGWANPNKMKLILGISFFYQHNSTGGGFLISKQIIESKVFCRLHPTKDYPISTFIKLSSPTDLLLTTLNLNIYFHLGIFTKRSIRRCGLSPG